VKHLGDQMITLKALLSDQTFHGFSERMSINLKNGIGGSFLRIAPPLSIGNKKYLNLGDGKMGNGGPSSKAFGRKSRIVGESGSSPEMCEAEWPIIATGMESKSIEVVNMKMLLIQFVSIVNLIQMKLMKVIDTMKSMMNKEFQRWMEYHLIEVMKMKMQMIQFVSIVNLIQMKLINVIHMMKNMMNKEFQRWMESKLIEVMNMKMLLI
jgi:hypothetical protein